MRRLDPQRIPVLALGVAGLAVAVSLMAAAVGRSQTSRSSTVSTRATDARVRAPEFPASFKWLNVKRPLTLSDDLKGRVVVLDFWTYCCINCMHIFPDLDYIEHKYADQPVAVVGVHSAKFENERDALQIDQAIQRYRIHHPVIVDEDFRLWNEYGVHGWPTLVFIDSQGRAVGAVSGEGHRELIDQVVAELLREGRENGTLATGPVNLPLIRQDTGPEHLYFPGKVTADPAGHRLFIADSNHNRIVVTDLAGQVQLVIGEGVAGLKDGPLSAARFNNPQGLAIDGQTVYVADTDNHALRKIDLKAGAVTTLAGTGQQGNDRRGGQHGQAQALSSPWDLAVRDGKVYIAMAGLHQLWRHDLSTGVTEAWVGSGAEEILDGPHQRAALAQPSGIALLGDAAYFADSEVSAIRRASLPDGTVSTLIGKGLFEFGFHDGPWDQARLQHPLGLAVLGENIAVADTYNHRLRLVDLKDKTIRTLYGGNGELNEPGGLAVAEGAIFIADTNHHRIVRFDPASGKARELSIRVPAPTTAAANR